MKRALCRNCDQLIVLLDSGNWVNADGISVCIKVELQDIGKTETPDYVKHNPMPEGFRGSPGTI